MDISQVIGDFFFSFFPPNEIPRDTYDYAPDCRLMYQIWSCRPPLCNISCGVSCENGAICVSFVLNLILLVHNYTNADVTESL